MARRKTMSELREIIRRIKHGQSNRTIRVETKTHRRLIRELRSLAKAREWLEEGQELPTEAQINAARKQHDEKNDSGHPLDQFHDDLERWVKAKYSYVAMHLMIKERYHCDESTVRRYVKKRFPKSVRPVMLRNTKPGEFMEVDFGSLGVTWDPDTKRARKTYLFSGRLRHSRKAHREMVFGQDQKTFFECHIHAFEHFGGVPEKSCVDNLKAAVIKASYENPLVNRSYVSLAEHYDFLISPCAPYMPRHKGGVESDVKYVKNNFMPVFKEGQRQKGREIPRADELREELARWSEEADERVIRNVGRSPLEIFEQEEAATLGPLPASRWDPVNWKQCRVARDWRVQFDKAFYSVPYRYIGEDVMVCGNSKIVHVFLDYEEICCHERAKMEWEYKRKSEHAPPKLEEYLNQSKKGLLVQALRIGASAHAVAESIFNEKAIDGLRPVRGLLRFADKYSRERLENACRRALDYGTPTYMSVKGILIKELDESQPDVPAKSREPVKFRFVREHGFFEPANREHNKTIKGETDG